MLAIIVPLPILEEEVMEIALSFDKGTESSISMDQNQKVWKGEEFLFS